MGEAAGSSDTEMGVIEQSIEYKLNNLKEIWGTDLKDLSCDQWIDECLKRFKCKKYLFVVDKTVSIYYNNNCKIK